MSQGRGSAIVTGAAIMVFLLMSLEVAQAATYIVGGPAGWTFNVVNWPQGKRFRAGDILVFNYSPAVHNLVIVNPGDYSRCTTSKTSIVKTSGNDRITLVKGRNSFICSVPGHCQSGMKITVVAN